MSQLSPKEQKLSSKLLRAKMTIANIAEAKEGLTEELEGLSDFVQELHALTQTPKGGDLKETINTLLVIREAAIKATGLKPDEGEVLTSTEILQALGNIKAK